MIAIDLTPQVILHCLNTKNKRTWVLCSNISMPCSLNFMIYSEISHKPFHVLQTNQALQNYIDMLSYPVAFLLYDKNDYFIPFLASISTLIHDIQHLSPLTQLSPSVI